MPDALALAQFLLQHDLAPLPIHANSKRAMMPWAKWQAEGIPVTQLPLLFSGDRVTVAAICGAASRNLISIDCDSRSSFERTRNQLNDPETWIVQSARGGHIHFQTPVPVRSIKADPERQILAQGCYVMAPGALHPSGVQYEFLRQTPSILELNSLHLLPGVTLEPILVRPTGMPRRAWKLLTGHTVTRTYHSDSEREMAAVCSMVNVGFDFARIHSAFVKLAKKSSHFGRWMTERGSRSAQAMLERMYREALKFTAHDSRDRTVAKYVRAHLLDHPLEGRTGSYDTCILDALLQIALQAGALTVAAGVRDLAERAGVSKEAANKATRRLIERGWIVLDTEWSGRFANVYRITPKPEFGLQNLYTSTKAFNVRECIGFATTENLFASDAFRWQGLGKSAALVYAQLAKASLTLDELAARTGKNPSTVSRALEKLRAASMIEPADLRGWAIAWKLVPSLDLAEVAQRLSTEGMGKRQKDAHICERDLYRKRLQEWQCERVE